MKIFNGQIKSQSLHQDTLGYNFGKTESEGESSYKDSKDSFFDDFLNVLPRIDDGYFIISGRKGAGKSAIAKYIQDNAVASDDLYCEIIKTDIINQERLIQETISIDNLNSSALFEWLILVKLVNLMLETENGKYTTEIKALRNFIRNNSGIVEVDKFTVSQIQNFSNEEIKIGALSNIFNGLLQRVIGKRLEKAPFYRILPALREIVIKSLAFQTFEKNAFVIIFDDLDINFNAKSEEDKKALLNLVRTAKDFNNTLKTNSIQNTKVLIFLRDDIQKVLEGFASDTNKIFSSYIIELRWYEKRSNETDEALRRFINRRIALNFQRNGVPFEHKDAWPNLIANKDDAYKGKTAFKFILDYTFYRPRDLILFCNNIGKDRYYIPINANNVKTLIVKYAADNVKELKDELTIHYSQLEIKNLFNVLREIAPKSYQGFSKDELIDKLAKYDLGSEVVDKLIDYSLVIPFDFTTSKYYIKYRGSNYEDFNIDSSNIKYRLHKCLCAYYLPDSV